MKEKNKLNKTKDRPRLLTQVAFVFDPPRLRYFVCETEYYEQIGDKQTLTFREVKQTRTYHDERDAGYQAYLKRGQSYKDNENYVLLEARPNKTTFGPAEPDPKPIWATYYLGWKLTRC